MYILVFLYNVALASQNGAPTLNCALFSNDFVLRSGPGIFKETSRYAESFYRKKKDNKVPQQDCISFAEIINWARDI